MAAFDDRYERIGVLLDVLGDFQNLSNELTGEPPFYSVIIECIDVNIETLKDARERILKIEKEVIDEQKQ
ncbi:hypothetical protein AGMMS50268_09170 [Spirochaetia bacterium]|nr:hypothetical protein AGMMS50268_09170 [Spirochaetia bacterium]